MPRMNTKSELSSIRMQFCVLSVSTNLSAQEWAPLCNSYNEAGLFPRVCIWQQQFLGYRFECLFQKKKFKRVRRIEDEESDNEDSKDSTNRDAIANELFEGSDAVRVFRSIAVAAFVPGRCLVSLGLALSSLCV